MTKYQRDEQASKTAVSVEERMNCLELHMGKGCLEKELNVEVYGLFGLDDEEIGMIEGEK